MKYKRSLQTRLSHMKFHSIRDKEMLKAFREKKVTYRGPRI